MQYRKLAGTDIEVSVLCYGPMRAAAKAPADDELSRAGEAALHAALDAGINFVHSSYEYGTRWMMHRALKDHPKRHDIHHVIKVPVPDWDDGGRFAAAKMRLRVEEALRDLAAERIAVLQWMWRTRPDDDPERARVMEAIKEEVQACFAALRQEGKAGHLWMFPYSVPAARTALATGLFGGMIAYCNAIEMDYLEVLPELEAAGRGFLAIRPLAAGVLTDKRSGWAALPEGDRLKIDGFREHFRRRAAIEATFGDEIGASMSRFAIRFPLFSPVCASVVVGLNTPAQVEEIARHVADVTPQPALIERGRALHEAGYER